MLGKRWVPRILFCPCHVSSTIVEINIEISSMQLDIRIWTIKEKTGIETLNALVYPSSFIEI